MEVLVDAGFSLDSRESSRRALKFRRDGEIIIVTHDGAGWFDPLSDRKGDVFRLAAILERTPFAEAVDRLGRLIGLGKVPVMVGRTDRQRPLPTVSQRWLQRKQMTTGSRSHRYLVWDRALPLGILQLAARNDLLREGPHGSTWFRHEAADDLLSGWEERGPLWRGFATGGAKELFRFGSASAFRICVTEAAIDALSLAALEDLRRDTLYVSTGGGWAPRTQAALEHYAARPEVHLVAATDANVQGEVYADRLRQMANAGACDFSRLRPTLEDWNEELKEAAGGEGKERRNAMAPDIHRIKGKASPAAGGP